MIRSCLCLAFLLTCLALPAFADDGFAAPTVSSRNFTPLSAVQNVTDTANNIVQQTPHPVISNQPMAQKIGDRLNDGESNGVRHFNKNVQKVNNWKAAQHQNYNNKIYNPNSDDTVPASAFRHQYVHRAFTPMSTSGSAAGNFND